MYNECCYWYLKCLNIRLFSLEIGALALNKLTELWKRDRMIGEPGKKTKYEASLAFYLLSPTRLSKSIIQELEFIIHVWH